MCAVQYELGTNDWRRNYAATTFLSTCVFIETLWVRQCGPSIECAAARMWMCGLLDAGNSLTVTAQQTSWKRMISSSWGTSGCCGRHIFTLMADGKPRRWRGRGNTPLVDTIFQISI